LWIRVAQRARVANLRVALAGYRSGNPGSLSKNVCRMETGMRAILEKLEASGLFRGSPLFRRRAWGYYWYSCGLMRQADGNPARAMSHSIRSLLRYPLPYGSCDVKSWFGRIRLFIAAARTQMRKLQITGLSHTPPEDTPPTAVQ